MLCISYCILSSGIMYILSHYDVVKLPHLIKVVSAKLLHCKVIFLFVINTYFVGKKFEVE